MRHDGFSQVFHNGHFHLKYVDCIMLLIHEKRVDLCNHRFGIVIVCVFFSEMFLIHRSMSPSLFEMKMNVFY